MNGQFNKAESCTVDNLPSILIAELSFLSVTWSLKEGVAALEKNELLRGPEYTPWSHMGQPLFTRLRGRRDHFEPIKHEFALWLSCLK